MDSKASVIQIDSFIEKLKKVVHAAKDVFGELPAFDYGTYTFIASINPYVVSDGMEHRNSTMITIGSNFNGNNELLSFFSHEFFHCWNVERIRPKSLEPFKFETSNMSEALWVAEGFTQYYGILLMRRAGLFSDEEFLKELTPLVNAKINTPGAQLYTPTESSQRAVFVDAGISIDATNYPNMFTTYYYYGGALALALDMELRSVFHKSLDDVMSVLWKKHGKKELPYTLSDVQTALAIVSGDTAYAAGFFKKHIYSHDTINYSKLFSIAGYSLKPIKKGKAWIGRSSFDSTGNGIVITTNTILNSPLYLSGVDVGDTLIEIDERKLHAIKDIDDIISKHNPSDTVSLVYNHRSNITKTTITLQENATVQIQPMEKEGKTLNANQQQFRERWFATSSK